MNTQLFLAALSTIFAQGLCSQYTVTDEAWFEIEIKDMDGPGQDYKGRFTVALFGEAAPMTVLNFVSITKGYKKGKVRKRSIFSRVQRVHCTLSGRVCVIQNLTFGLQSSRYCTFTLVFMFHVSCFFFTFSLPRSFPCQSKLLVSCFGNFM